MLSTNMAMDMATTEITVMVAMAPAVKSICAMGCDMAGGEYARLTTSEHRRGFLAPLPETSASTPVGVLLLAAYFVVLILLLSSAVRFRGAGDMAVFGRLLLVSAFLGWSVPLTCTDARCRDGGGGGFWNLFCHGLSVLLLLFLTLLLILQLRAKMVVRSRGDGFGRRGRCGSWSWW